MIAGVRRWVERTALAALLSVLCCAAAACGGGGGTPFDQNFPSLEESRADCEFNLNAFVAGLNNGDYDTAMSYTSKHVYWRKPGKERGYTQTKGQLEQYQSFSVTFTVTDFTQHQDTATLTINLSLNAVALPGSSAGNLALTGTQKVSFFFEEDAWLLYGIFTEPPTG